MESNLQPFVSQASAQSNEPHQLKLYFQFLKCLKLKKNLKKVIIWKNIHHIVNIGYPLGVAAGPLWKGSL